MDDRIWCSASSQWKKVKRTTCLSLQINMPFLSRKNFDSDGTTHRPSLHQTMACASPNTVPSQKKKVYAILILSINETKVQHQEHLCPRRLGAPTEIFLLRSKLRIWHKRNIIILICTHHRYANNLVKLHAYGHEKACPKRCRASNINKNKNRRDVAHSGFLMESFSFLYIVSGYQN